MFHTIVMMEQIVTCGAVLHAGLHVVFGHCLPCVFCRIKSTSIYKEDREIYLNIVDLDPSPDNKYEDFMRVPAMNVKLDHLCDISRVFADVGTEKRKEYEVPHSFVEAVLKICKVCLGSYS